MSGILGLCNLDGRPVEPELLAKMSATLAHRGPDGEGQWLEGSVGLGCQLMRVTPESLQETQPLVHPSGPVIVFDGRLDNREELLDRLKGAWGTDRGSPDPALVLAAYEAFGDSFPRYLNGDFALAVFDPRRLQLLLARDVIGVRPLYYHQGGTFLFASEIKAILAHPQVVAEPNDDFLADLFLKGLHCPQEGLTFFQDVFDLLPGHIAVLGPKGLVVRQYWDFDPAQKIRLSSFQDYVEAFRHLFEQAVRRRLRSAYPVGAEVSGGLDSSSIFCQAEFLRKSGAASYPDLVGLNMSCPDGSETDEEAYVLEIEGQYGSAIKRVPLLPINSGDKPEEEIWHSEVPFLEYGSYHRLMQAAQQRRVRTMLTGEGGDQYLADLAYMLDLYYNLAWKELWQHIQEVPHWDCAPAHYSRVFLKKLVKHHLPKPLKNLLLRLSGGLSNIGGRLPNCTSKLLRRASRERISPFAAGQRFGNAHASSLYKLLRSAYELFHLERPNKLYAAYGIDCAFPFYDRDLLTFLMGIPGEVINRQGVCKGILREALRGILPEAIAARRCKAGFTQHVNDGIAQYFNRISNYLQDDSMVVRKGYVAGAGLGGELDRLRKSLDSHNYSFVESLYFVLSFELWLQVFVDIKS